jgi:hypothetical protein
MCILLIIYKVSRNACRNNLHSEIEYFHISNLAVSSHVIRLYLIITNICPGV